MIATGIVGSSSGFLDLSNVVAIGALGIALVCSIIASITSLIYKLNLMKKIKKIAIWLLVISIIVFIITWGVIGVKLLDNNYEFMMEAYIAYGSLAVFFICLIYVRSGYRCPHCGKEKLFFWKYCPYCGKEIK